MRHYVVSLWLAGSEAANVEDVFSGHEAAVQASQCLLRMGGAARVAIMYEKRPGYQLQMLHLNPMPDQSLLNRAYELASAAVRLWCRDNDESVVIHTDSPAPTV